MTSFTAVEVYPNRSEQGMSHPLKPIPPLTEPIRILVAVAHHDDIEFGVGGSVARWVQEGASVTYVIITDGGAGSNDPNITRAELVERRRHEQMAAAAAVGVQDVRFLGYPDGLLTPSLELRRDLTRIVRELKPHRVILQDPTTVYVENNYINHPDHRAAGEAMTYAVFPSAETRLIFPELLAEGYEPHHVSEVFLTLSLHNTHYVDITTTMERKLSALRAHISQIGEGEAVEKGVLGWTREYCAEAGARVGVEYAELYRVMDFSRPPSEKSARRQRETQTHPAAEEQPR
jgi:LmbE family N-acetylglucosaminyl deacetylase